MATPTEVAEWMVRQFETQDYLYREDVVYQIEEIFGPEFIYENENGNQAIDKKVLREFRKLTEEDVVWERGERTWRKRELGDPPGKRQVD